MSNDLQFGLFGMRSRIGVSILLISALTAGFVFYFSKNNRDIAALNRVALEIASLTDSLKPIISSSERIRIPQSSTELQAHLSIIEEHYAYFGEKLSHVDDAFLDLDADIQTGFKEISSLRGDAFWMYRDFYYRVEELVKIHTHYTQNTLNKYIDFKGQAHEIDISLPYRSDFTHRPGTNSVFVAAPGQSLTRHQGKYYAVYGAGEYLTIFDLFSDLFADGRPHRTTD